MDEYIPIIESDEEFKETFIPTRLYHRDGQIKEIASCLKPALHNKSINNVFLYGSTGTGKTVITKWILQENFKGISAYVNCWSNRTEHKVLEEILLQLGFVIHGRESTNELTKKFEKSVRKKVIVCLDEVDQLKDKKILYTLARRDCGLILISNCSFLSGDLDGRIKSSLLLNEIEFPAYSQSELYDILRERVETSFRNGSVSQEAIRIAAILANGDARVGLQTLVTAARNAESKSLSQIAVDDIRQAVRGARKYRLSYVLKKLNEDQRLIYGILKKNTRMDSGQLYRQYSKLTSQPVVDRAYRNYMRRMVELGLVKIEGLGRWKRYVLSS